jgi:hypothetical protein
MQETIEKEQKNLKVVVHYAAAKMPYEQEHANTLFVPFLHLHHRWRPSSSFSSNKEDGLCDVTDYSGNGKLMCTRDGYNAIIELAERHREFLRVPDDYFA